MDAARWERIQVLFHEVADLPGPAQRAFLETECRDDPALMAEVLGLLEEDARGESLLDRDVANVAGQVLEQGIPPALLDQDFGPYRMQRMLGEGGMGVVYLAERADLGSVAAIKILRDAWLSPDRRERFASEQRSLAQLNHPAIARLYDASTLPDGTPWFVMEYVEGVPLTKFCEEHASAMPQRLRLFRAVCEAVEHAHRHLIVHRDLKPSNILVKPDGSVKLLDFGIAKQLDSLEGPVDRTRTGLRLMTPAYAAPEQILGEPVGIHTDIYTLGVVLYELLTGRLPFDLANRTPGEAATVIVEQGPERPSATARETAAGGSPLPSVSKRAWADLDVLCLTAMRKEPERRYRTVEALIRDVDHYLAGEPLEARPDTLGYRLGKYVRRNWRPVSAAAASFIIVISLVVFYTVRLATARNAAVAEAARTQRIQRFMLNLFQGGDEAVGPADSLRVVTLVDRGVQDAQPRCGARGAGRAVRDAGKHLPEARQARPGGFAAPHRPRPTPRAVRIRPCRDRQESGGARQLAGGPSRVQGSGAADPGRPGDEQAAASARPPGDRQRHGCARAGLRGERPVPRRDQGARAGCSAAQRRGRHADCGAGRQHARAGEHPLLRGAPCGRRFAGPARPGDDRHAQRGASPPRRRGSHQPRRRAARVGAL